MTLPLQQSQEQRTASFASRLLPSIPLLGLAFFAFLIHISVAQNYGYFRDELYYLAAGHHLTWGYLDFPPLMAMLAALLHVFSLDSLLGIHFLPALACALIVFMTGLIARQLGGGRFSEVLAALASIVTIEFLASGSLFSMDVFDQLWWVLALSTLIRLIRQDQPRLWLLFGLIVGIGLLTKLTMLYFGAAVTLSLLFVPQRKYFRSPWLWLGGLIALLFLLPYIFWEQVNGWPSLEFWRNYASHPDSTSLLVNIAEEIFVMNPFNLPLIILGFCSYFSRTGRTYRLFGWMSAFLLVVFTLEHAKAYFPTPMYPVFYAAGAILFERFVTKSLWRKYVLAPGSIVVLVLSGLLLAPIAMPILPPNAYIAIYGKTFGDPSNPHHAPGQFPQWLGDRFEWDHLVSSVAKIYNRLPPVERAHACILTSNYGEAGAFDLLGSAYHLPQVISGHNTYYLWGPGTCTGQVVLAVGFSTPDDLRLLKQTFGSITVADTIHCVYCQPNEDNLPIDICQHPFTSLQDVWARFKHFNK